MAGLFGKRNKDKERDKLVDDLLNEFLKPDDKSKNGNDYDGLSLDEAIERAIANKDSDIFYKKNGNLKKRFRFVLTGDESMALQKIMRENKRKRLERKVIAKGGISYLGKKNKQNSE